jgi:hypothetical protein
MIAVEDVAYARIAAPDLDLMESCLADFGPRRALRTKAALYMRGHGSDPVIHIIERGPARHIGLAFNRIEVVYGLEAAPPAGLREPVRFNPAHSRSRHNHTVRNECAPSHVTRLGHAALHATAFPAMFAFYRGIACPMPR